MTYSAQMHIASLQNDLSIMTSARDKNLAEGNILTAQKCSQRSSELLEELTKAEDAVEASKRK